MTTDIDHILLHLDVADDLDLDLKHVLRVVAVRQLAEYEVGAVRGGDLVAPTVAEELELVEEAWEEGEWPPVGELLDVHLFHGLLTPSEVQVDRTSASATAGLSGPSWLDCRNASLPG